MIRHGFFSCTDENIPGNLESWQTQEKEIVFITNRPKKSRQTLEEMIGFTFESDEDDFPILDENYSPDMPYPIICTYEGGSSPGAEKAAAIKRFLRGKKRQLKGKTVILVEDNFATLKLVLNDSQLRHGIKMRGILYQPAVVERTTYDSWEYLGFAMDELECFFSDIEETINEVSGDPEETKELGHYIDYGSELIAGRGFEYCLNALAVIDNLALEQRQRFLLRLRTFLTTLIQAGLSREFVRELTSGIAKAIMDLAGEEFRRDLSEILACCDRAKLNSLFSDELKISGCRELAERLQIAFDELDQRHADKKARFKPSVLAKLYVSILRYLPDDELRLFQGGRSPQLREQQEIIKETIWALDSILSGKYVEDRIRAREKLEKLAFDHPEVLCPMIVAFCEDRQLGRAMAEYIISPEGFDLYYLALENFAEYLETQEEESEQKEYEGDILEVAEILHLEPEEVWENLEVLLLFAEEEGCDAFVRYVTRIDPRISEKDAKRAWQILEQIAEESMADETTAEFSPEEDCSLDEPRDADEEEDDFFHPLPSR
ncbi:MAG: DUF2608 domain-containing protein [Candidatus Omnitrophica bacterium]|nr:DUF2608 domain-containing protein [Candidatus Omnitrophota bacterium]